jgi:hypothetical protein
MGRAGATTYVVCSYNGESCLRDTAVSTSAWVMNLRVPMASAALFSWYTEACVAAKGFVVFPSLLIAAQIKYAIKMPTKNHTGLFIF